MAVPKGTRIGGRQKGTRNKRTAEAASQIEAAFAHLQTASQAKARRDLKSWAEDNTGDFYKLIWPKLLPLQLNHADNEGGKLKLGWLTE